jgi:integrase
MPTIKITEAVRARALRRPLEPAVYRDSEIPGFTLHVVRKRSFWALHYGLRGCNPRTGKRNSGGKRFELGDAVAMPLAAARTAALRVKSWVREGSDPLGERLAQRAAIAQQPTIVPTTVAEALETFERVLLAKTGSKPSPKTRRETIRYARKAVTLMDANKLLIGTITKLMVRLMLDEFAQSQTEKRLVFSGLNQFLTWSRRRELIERNPIDDLDRAERPKPAPARRTVPPISILKSVWGALELEQPHVRGMIRFLLVSALRRDEAAELRWDEVNLNKGIVAIGADRMKNREEHIVPLSAPALAVLEAQTRNGLLVFAAPDGKSFTGWSSLLARIRKRVNVDQAKLRLHDFRRSFASILCDAGHSPDVLERCLAHKRVGVAGIYNRAEQLTARRAALDAWAQMLTGVDPADNVLPWRRNASN